MVIRVMIFIIQKHSSGIKLHLFRLTNTCFLITKKTYFVICCFSSKDGREIHYTHNFSLKNMFSSPFGGGLSELCPDECATSAMLQVAIWNNQLDRPEMENLISGMHDLPSLGFRDDKYRHCDRRSVATLACLDTLKTSDLFLSLLKFLAALYASNNVLQK